MTVSRLVGWLTCGSVGCIVVSAVRAILRTAALTWPHSSRASQKPARQITRARDDDMRFKPQVTRAHTRRWCGRRAASPGTSPSTGGAAQA
eukprot:scaffold36351_cov65-Phaeocystis_antarctica.AAC.10